MVSEEGGQPHEFRFRQEESVLLLQLSDLVGWIENKFNLARKVETRNSPCPGSWTKELVVGNVKHEEELDLLRQAGITLLRLKDVLSEMIEKRTVVKAAAGADLFDLMLLKK
jgi:hypothetical protein